MYYDTRISDIMSGRLADWIEKLKTIVYTILAIRKYYEDPEVRKAIDLLLEKAQEIKDVYEGK